jgi:hypothetical protein
VKSILGELSLTSQQAQQLGVASHTRLSPYLELCCLRVSANVSYKHTEKDVELFTGIRVPAKTQQRLVQRQSFDWPQTEQPIQELSADGGKIRIRTPLGQECRWLDYKGVRLHEFATGACFQDNQQLIDWVCQQPLNCPLTCLGDGHDGVWNLIQPMAPEHQRREILDWYHLMENLEKVGGSMRRLNQARAVLWQGDVDAALALFATCNRKQATNFCAYLRKHRHRIVNYEYYQSEQICSYAFGGAKLYGSGAVESAVKQIDRRTKISGAQWKQENVPQVLAHRCAYLNDLLTL